ncbi:hypothetical protein ACQB60_40880 [Actinomycetota bacterium Odt1-20B]
MDNVDVFVDLKDGSRWSTTIITVAQAEVLMKRWVASREALSGCYFRCSGGLTVHDAGISNMTEILTGLAENGMTSVKRARSRFLLERVSSDDLTRYDHRPRCCDLGPCDDERPQASP